MRKLQLLCHTKYDIIPGRHELKNIALSCQEMGINISIFQYTKPRESWPVKFEWHVTMDKRGSTAEGTMSGATMASLDEFDTRILTFCSDLMKVLRKLLNE